MIDTLELYRWAVQDPRTQVTVMQLMFNRLRPGQQATVLREDFAGTSAESMAWIALGEHRQALAVDLDGPTLAWAARRARQILGERATALQFLQADVMAVAPPAVPAADILSVLNFSIFYFHQREPLRAYLHHARNCLSEQGMLVMNAFGGAATLHAHTDTFTINPTPQLPGEEAIAPFEYHWQQGEVDALSHRLDCRIHFSVADPDGGQHREIQDAFHYDWRLWSPLELRELLEEVGFTEVQIWRHSYDPEAEGVFLGPIESLTGLDSWVVYLVALR